MSEEERAKLLALLDPQPDPIFSDHSVMVTPGAVMHLLGDYLGEGAPPEWLDDLLTKRGNQGAQKYNARLFSHTGRKYLADLVQELVDGLFYASALALEAEGENASGAMPVAAARYAREDRIWHLRQIYYILLVLLRYEGMVPEREAADVADDGW